jgi:hypothetical protein
MLHLQFDKMGLELLNYIYVEKHKSVDFIFVEVAVSHRMELG